MTSIEKNLKCLGHLNLHLADEVAKLPEIRKFKTDSSRLALSNLIKIYRFAPHEFDSMFEAMNRIGLPKFRKYCSALQAMLWLLQDEKMSASGLLLGLTVERRVDETGNGRPYLISDPESSDEEYDSRVKSHEYTIERILDAAWKDECLLLQRSAINQIINRIQTASEAEEYALLLKRHDDLQLQRYIMDDFMKKRKIFDVNDWHRIRTAVDQSRWKVFSTVADRLNAPELISYYINKFFSFRKTPSSGVFFTFFDNKAQCTDAAYFAQFLLERAGYKTFIRSVKWDNDPWDGHHTGAGVILEDGRYLLVSSYTGLNSMSGPYSSLESLDRKLSCDRKIVDRKWGAYYPPRYY